MGEPKMEILETNVKHNTEDIRDMKKRQDRQEMDISDLKIDSQTAKQNFGHVFGTLSKLETTMTSLDDKLDRDREERKNDEIAQLKNYKNFMWKVAAGIIVAVLSGIIGAALIVQ